jgi:hypothetical protein
MRYRILARSVMGIGLGLGGLLGVACSSSIAEDGAAPGNTAQVARASDLLKRRPPGPIGGKISSNWASPWDALGGRAEVGTSPTLVKAGSRLHAFIFSPNGGGIEWNYSDDNGPWRGWTLLDGAANGKHLAAVASTSGTYVVILYVHPGDYRLFANLYDGTSWSGPKDLGFGNALGDPAAVYLQTPNGVPGVFGGGFLPYVNVYAWDFVTQTLQTTYFLINAPDDPFPWTTLSGIPPKSNPGGQLTIVSSDNVSVDLFSFWGSSVLHGHEVDSSQPFSWELVPTPSQGNIASFNVTSTAPGHVDAVWETWSSSEAFSKSFINGAWQPDVDLDSKLFGYTNGYPALAPLAGEIAAVATGPHYEIESAMLSEGASSPFTPITTGCEAFASEPAMVATSATRLDLLAIGTDNAVYHTYYDVAAPTGDGTQPPTCGCAGSGQMCCGGGDAPCGPGLVCRSPNTCVSP